MEVKNVDSQGRISLPSDWRRKVLQKERRVLVIAEGDELRIKAPKDTDLTSYFDAIEVDVDPDKFRDPHELKRALLEA